MRMFAPGFLLGACIVFYLQSTPSLFYLLPIAFLLAPLFYWRKKLIIRFVLGFSLGFFWLVVYLHFFAAASLPKRLEGEKLLVTGTVVSIPVKNTMYDSFVFSTQSINHKKYKLKINWYYAPYDLKVGERWHLTVKLKRPHGTHNPGAFDYSQWAFQNKISAAGYVVKDSGNKKLQSSWFVQPANRLRADLLNKFQAMFPKQKMGGFLEALTLGWRSTITQADWQTLQRTGTSHLVAISGLHIGLVASLVFFLVDFLWRRVAFLSLRISAQQVAASVSLFVAAFYCMLAGFSLPTQRALIMLSVVLIALILKRRILAWHGLACALFLVLLFDPLSVLSMSFWLSFSAVAVIIYGVSGRLKTANKWRQIINVQLIVTIGLIPLSIYFFQKTSIVSPFANAVAIPWVGLIVVPLSLLGSLLLLINHTAAHAVLWLALKNMQGAWWYLNKLASLPFAAWHYSLPQPVLLGFLCLAVLLLLAPRGISIKYLAIFFLLPVIFVSRSLIAHGHAKVTLLDVGQGLSVVIQTQHHVLVYDTGPGRPGSFNAGDSVLNPFLRWSGVKKVNVLVISHTDNDHVGGANALLQQYPARLIYTSNPKYFHHIRHVIACHAGQHWTWDGVKFSMLYPGRKKLASKNNNSCVLQVTVGNKIILLPGDIEKGAEKYLVKRAKKDLSAVILIAPHHGSKTSSTWPFAKAVRPQYVLFATGYRNRFHFPSAPIVQRYHILGAKELTTATSGAISFNIAPNQPLNAPKQYAVDHHKLWF